MSYDKLPEIFDEIQRLHERVARACKAHAGELSGQQQELLVETVGSDQQRLRALAADYAASSIPGDGEPTWIQFVPDEELESIVTRIAQLDASMFDELVQAVADFYQAMENFLQRISEQTESEEVSEVLDDFAQLERENAKQLSKRLIGLRDV